MTKKILVVDDEEEITGFLKNLLEGEGYEVETANSGKGALEKMKKESFDLVLLDFFMHGMSGREVADRMRKNKKTAKTKIAFLTGAEFSKQGEKELEKLGSKDYIKKPFVNEDLIKRIKKILG